MDGFTIPIGADFSVMQEAVDQIVAAMERMGSQIVAALQQSNAAAMQTAAAMGQVQQRSAAAAASTAAAGAAAGGAATRFASAATTAGNLGAAASGAVSVINALNAASRALSGINLAQHLGNWVRSVGGLRGALGAIPRAMAAIAGNRTFQLVAVAALAAVTAIIAVRTAFRIAAAATRLLKSAGAAVFQGLVSGAKSAAGEDEGGFLTRLRGHGHPVGTGIGFGRVWHHGSAVLGLRAHSCDRYQPSRTRPCCSPRPARRP